MRKSARYEKVEMESSGEAHLLARIEELEERLDRLQTALTEHKHVGDTISIDLNWMF